MKVKRITEYFHWILGTIDKSGIVADRSAASFKVRSKCQAAVYAPRIRSQRSGLIFCDNSTLNLREEIRISRSGELDVISYVYHYERPDGFFFRYEKLAEPHPDPIFEPTLHLHVIHDAPRFPTHCTNLAQVLDVIRVNFFR